jgi:hypothetical protein
VVAKTAGVVAVEGVNAAAKGAATDGVKGAGEGLAKGSGTDAVNDDTLGANGSTFLTGIGSVEGMNGEGTSNGDSGLSFIMSSTEEVLGDLVDFLATEMGGGLRVLATPLPAA